VVNFDVVPTAQHEKIKEAVTEEINHRLSFPIPLVIINASSSGIRNVYIELEFAQIPARLALPMRRLFWGLFRK
jgi:hypothetical protein